MSGIGSLGLDSTSRYFMQGTKYLMSKVIVAPSRVIISAAPCCIKELLCKKCALLKKKQAAKKLISSCTPTTSALLLYHYLLYYCCMACTYCQQCCDTSVHSTVVPPLLCVRTAVIASYPQNSRRHSLYVLPILQQWG